MGCFVPDSYSQPRYREADAAKKSNRLLLGTAMQRTSGIAQYSCCTNSLISQSPKLSESLIDALYPERRHWLGVRRRWSPAACLKASLIAPEGRCTGVQGRVKLRVRKEQRSKGQARSAFKALHRCNERRDVARRIPHGTDAADALLVAVVSRAQGSNDTLMICARANPACGYPQAGSMEHNSL